MTIPSYSEIRTPRSEIRTRYQSTPCRKLANAMAATWPSAEAFAIDLADEALMGRGRTIHIVPRTAQKWRNGETGPMGVDVDRIKRLISLITEQQIRAAYARLEALKQG